MTAGDIKAADDAAKPDLQPVDFEQSSLTQPVADQAVGPQPAGIVPDLFNLPDVFEDTDLLRSHIATPEQDLERIEDDLFGCEAKRAGVALLRGRSYGSFLLTASTSAWVGAVLLMMRAYVASERLANSP